MSHLVIGRASPLPKQGAEAWGEGGRCPGAPGNLAWPQGPVAKQSLRKHLPNLAPLCLLTPRAEVSGGTRVQEGGRQSHTREKGTEPEGLGLRRVSQGGRCAPSLDSPRVHPAATCPPRCDGNPGPTSSPGNDSSPVGYRWAPASRLSGQDRFPRGWPRAGHLTCLCLSFLIFKTTYLLGLLWGGKG